MSTQSSLPVTRRTALAVAAAALAWRPSIGRAAAGGSTAAEALHVLDRCAFGPAPGDLERVVRMGSEAWIDEQLHPERIPLPGSLTQALGALVTTGQSQHDLVRKYRELEASAKRQQADMGGAASAAQQLGGGQGQRARSPDMMERRELVQLVHLEAADTRLLQALQSPRQLQEVMVEFWFNHFNVFDGKGLDKVLIADYERNAIRPNVLGRFRTLLEATARHPAMLFYLDNWLSVAPGYQPRRKAANRTLSGLNENYARELMELHTLGVEGGYTQADVTELARMLTGWTLMNAKGGHGGMQAVEGDSLFGFDPERHDGGTKHWLGHTVEPSGMGEGEFALDVLARHPATARRISYKLAQRFVADEPPQALVDRLARRFLETDGDIRAILKTLFDSPEFRDPKYRRVKFKTPYQYVLSAVRATGIPTTNVRPLVATLSQLGQPLFGCQTPDGWKDVESAWLNPGAIMQRVNFATALASGRMPLVRLDNPGKRRGNGENAMAREVDAAQQDGGNIAGSTPPVDAGALLATLGPAIGEKTRAAVAQGEPALRGALVLGSPDFMRR